MPRLVRWYVKTALLWLVIALILKALDASPWATHLPALTPVSWHALFVGWLTQLIFGIAHWMLPTKPGASKDRLRGDERLVWAAWGLLNVGLILRLIAEPAVTAGWQGPLWPGLLILAAWLQWLAAILYVVNAWARVRPATKRGQRG